MPIETKVGYGLYLGHTMCLVVNNNTIIGNNVNLSQFTNIGANSQQEAIICDNVYIAPMVCLVENVEIVFNARIGAGAVVTRNIPSGKTAAGVPAHIISDIGQGYWNNYPIQEM